MEYTEALKVAVISISIIGVLLGSYLTYQIYHGKGGFR